MRKIVGLLLLPLLLGGWNVHGKWTLTNGLTEGQSATPLQTSHDDGFINEFKTAQAWTYMDNTSHPAPNELDVNGYPLYGANAFSHGGVYSVFFGPSQTERPGTKTILAGGAGVIESYETAGGGTLSNVACQYTSNGGALTNGTYTKVGTTGGQCDTTACTGTCTFSWTFSIATESRNTFIEWALAILAVNSGNTLQNIAFIHTADEAVFGWTMANWPGPNAISSNPHVSNTGQIGGVLFEARVAQGGFGIWRWMDWMNSAGAFSMCTTWSTRKPTSYVYYSGQEMRNSIYVSNPTYSWTQLASFTGTITGTEPSLTLTVSGVTGTPLAIGQSIAGPGVVTGVAPIITGGSGSTWTISSTTQTATGPATMTTNTNDYSATLGTGPPVNKQIIIAGWNTGTTATNGQITFNLNGTGALPVLTYQANPIQNGSTYYFPTAGYYGSLIFDSELNGGAGAWLSFTGLTFDNTNGINCGIPPEIALQLSIEMRVHPWFDAYPFSLVPLTDFMPSLFAYVKANAPPGMIPRFTAGNEPFNNGGYAGAKAGIYWNLPGDYLDWFGMAASLMCQALYNVYGDSSKYECMVEPQVATGGPSSGYPLITSPQYVANGPAQAGYAQDPAYKWLTAIAINNYWIPVENGQQQEVADAYNYSNGGNQATILDNYVNTALNAGGFGITQYNIWFGDYATWLAGGIHQCGGNATNCNIKNMYFYEGGYNINFATADKTVPITGVTSNASPCVLTTASGNGVGGVTGQAWALSAIVNGGGGTWVTTPGTYSGTMSANGTSTTLTLGLDCTSLGALTSATLTYTGSQTYLKAMQQASYAAPAVGTLTTTNYNNIIAAGGKYPSMFYLAGTLPGADWAVWTPDIYGATSSASDPGPPQWRCIQVFNNVGGISCP